MNSIECMSPELIRLAFVAGMILSVFLYEKSHVTTGSIVVPGFLGVHLFEPVVVVTCFVNAWVCYALVHQIIPRFWMMSSPAKFHSLIVASIFIQLFWAFIVTIESPIAVIGDSMAGFGYVIPGLIAHDMARNGRFKTVLNAGMAALTIGLLVLAMLIAFPTESICSHRDLFRPSPFHLVSILALSSLGSMLLKTRFSIRSGGYVTAAYMVFSGASLPVFFAIATVSLATLAICRFVIIPNMIIFGRRKFATMLIVGSLSMWASTMLIEWLGVPTMVSSHPSYAGVMILLPGLIANDMQRSSVANVASGLGLLVGWIYLAASWLARACSECSPIHILPLLALFTITAVAFSTKNGSYSRPSDIASATVNSH